ncbi:prolipoprotein diacylglyceryl transferase [Flavobacterium aquidurense]|uniref:prolipoprotein diacylglyceryl transferase n=1 Tax=Flavobacterium aquidurense TaxID=362413 RepID=UPI00371E16A3
MNIINWDWDPTIFWITDSFPLKYYGVFFICGLLLGYIIVRRMYINEKKTIKELDNLLIYIILGTILGARLGHCFFYEPDYFFNHPIEILLPIKKVAGSYKFVGFAGLASHGGTIGIFIAVYIYCRRYKTDLLWILDKITFGVPIAAAFIRFGNFMNSEIYGKPTSGSWGVVFQREDLIPRHPTQIYEALVYLFIFGILLVVHKSKIVQNTNGILFGCFLILLFTARFFIEFFKENQVDFENSLPLNMGQFLSIPFIFLGIIIMVWQLNIRNIKLKYARLKNCW